MMARSIGIGILAAALMLGSSLAHASTLRIALNEDPDALDPASGVSFAGRVVFASLCDKLVDIDARLNYLPQLATEWSWSADNLTLTMKLRSGVVFQDGEPFDAEAVKYNIERYQNAPFSKRKTELKQVKSVEAIDPTTVAFHLSEPSAPLIGVLSDRAGMMVSPKAGTTAGDKFGANPVCAGPYKFRSRVAQEKITVERFDRYWNRAAIGIDEVEFVPVPDSAVRLANLKSGGFDIIERVPPTDAPAIASDQRLKLVESPATLSYHISINLVGPQVAPPLAQDARVREALDAAIDRTVLNQVVFNGKYVPNNQPILPGSSYYDADIPVPPRDLAKAKGLLREAGVEYPAFTLLVANSPIDQQVAQVIQSMVGEAGFDMKIQAVEANTLVAAAQKGDYQATLVFWSGRPDPDGNISIWLQCDGSLNWGHYCNPKVDEALAKARQVTEPKERLKYYKDAANLYLADHAYLFLYHIKWIWGTTARLDGFSPGVDGLIRPQGMTLKP
ncbi:MAG TPA: ABC transporter substrate-binding protein [Stellaceae bacterium]|nr:ABC transporter substrate-binding protein [Stellaceae bacterium]